MSPAQLKNVQIDKKAELFIIKNKDTGSTEQAERPSNFWQSFLLLYEETEAIQS